MEILMNWLWQGVAVALAAAVLLRITRRRVSATTRHHILWAALAVVLLLPLLPLLEGVQELERTEAPVGVPAVVSAAPAVISDQVMPVPTIVLPSLPIWGTLLFLLVVQRIHNAVRAPNRRCPAIASPHQEHGAAVSGVPRG